MRKVAIGIAAGVALIGTPGLAAPMAVKAPPPAAPVTTNWSGCYVGGVAGITSGQTNRIEVVDPHKGPAVDGLPITPDFDLRGFTGGFDVGCNYQTGAWVWSVEGDWSATTNSGQAFELAPFDTLAIHETQERWVATARGRLGWTFWDRSLLYVTGGGAWTRVDSSKWLSFDPSSPKTFFNTSTVGGWVVGAGIEYALGYGWSARGEYLYEDFGKNNTIFHPLNANLETFKLYNHVFRVGLNYKFW